MPPQNLSSDGELLERMVAGDEEAFMAIYRRHQSRVYSYALHMSGSPAVAEDVTQEVFMVLVRAPSAHDPVRGTLQAYLLGIARHHVLRGLKGRRSFISVTDLTEGTGTATREELISADDPLGKCVRQETIERVRAAVLVLPEHYREAVVLCDLNELSYEEAAAAVGCAVGTIRSRLHRGRSILIEKLRPRDDSAEESRTASTRCFA